MSSGEASIANAGGQVGWFDRARRGWRVAVPSCGEIGCTPSRRLWRRIRWWNGAIGLHGLRYCTPQCFERALRDCFSRARSQRFAPGRIQHRIPLGLLMLSRGQLTNHQLRSALGAQKESGRYRLGEWLQRLGFATEQQVTAALGLQWACPVLASRAHRDPGCSGLLPHRLLVSTQLLPLRFVPATRTFYLAFSNGIDYPVLEAIERMLDCHTDACLVTRSTMDRSLEEISHDRRPGDFLFEGWRDETEMARITCSYVLKLGAEDVRVAAIGTYIWTRLAAGKDSASLLFRRLPGVAETSGLESGLMPSHAG